MGSELNTNYVKGRNGNLRIGTIVVGLIIIILQIVWLTSGSGAAFGRGDGIVYFCLVVSIIWLILLLVLPHHDIFKLIDWIYHLIAGILLIIAGILCVLVILGSLRRGATVGGIIVYLIFTILIFVDGALYLLLGVAVMKS